MRHAVGRWNFTPCAGMSKCCQPNAGFGLVTAGGLAGSFPQPATTAATAARETRAARTPTKLPRGAGMGLEVDVLEALGRQVGVDLCRGDVGVAEHLLHRPQVTAAGEQVGGEGVAQRVRAHLAVQAGLARVALDDLVEAL